MAFPNPDTQFKPGESGNPAGKPKGTKHLSTHIQEMLNDPDFELKLKDGTVLKGAPIKAILKTAIAKGVSGDMRAFDIIAKYGYGNKIDITTNGKELPQPILKLDGVLRNNSDEENNQPQ
jgi:hypothetical protein